MFSHAGARPRLSEASEIAPSRLPSPVFFEYPPEEPDFVAPGNGRSRRSMWLSEGEHEAVRPAEEGGRLDGVEDVEVFEAELA